MKRNEPWRKWIPVLLWIGVIALESTELLSAANTGHWLHILLLNFFGPIDWAQISAVNHGLRTVGHLVGYGILSWLSYRAWRATLPVGRSAFKRLHWMALALALTTAVASLDEFHQSFLPSRTGKVSDVVLDSAAAVAVQLLIFVQCKSKQVTPLS